MSFIDRFKKNEKSFEQFVAEMTPTLSMMAIIDYAEMIGISHHEYTAAMNRPARIVEKEKNDQLTMLMEVVNNRIDDEEFKKKVISKIMFFNRNGKFVINEDMSQFKATYINDDYVIYSFKLNIAEKNIDFNFSDSISKVNLNGEHKLQEQGKILIKYNDTKVTVYNTNSAVEYYDVKNNNTVMLFDKNKVQQFQYEKNSIDNYGINTKTGEKIIPQPSPFENKEETSYAWRATKNAIILRETTKYYYDGEQNRNISNFLIGQNVDPKAKRLPKGGRFVWFDDELYTKYINGEATINDIYENLGSNYQKKLDKKRT